jgi:TIR domain-containing protein
MNAYWFYLSCAQADWEPHLECFYHDLSHFLSERVGVPQGGVGYFGGNEIKTGARWDDPIISALNSSRVFIPLFTPAYFLSEDCGREWQIFRSRQKLRNLTLTNEGSYTSLIMPLLWVPQRDLPLLPPAIASEVQYGLGDFRESYPEHGLRQLMTLKGFHKEYQDFLIKFANRVFETATEENLFQLEKLPPMTAIPSAFDELKTRELVIGNVPTRKIDRGDQSHEDNVEDARVKRKGPLQATLTESAQEEASKIFISYRRHDTEGFAGRLFDQLSIHFGEQQIFMDIDTIEAGEDFIEVIEQAVSSCSVMIAVIGPRWLTSVDGEGRRRLDNPEDFVRVEISTALQRNIRVVPVLVQGASIPKSTQLPEVLAKLARRNAFELSSTRWKYDVERLILIIEKVLRKSKPSTRR